MVGNVHQLIPDLQGHVRLDGLEERTLFAEPGQPQAVLGLNAAKLHPGVAPGIVFVGAVGGHQVRTDEKALAPAEVVGHRGAVLLADLHPAPAGDHIVEQVVVAHMGTVGMERLALLPAVLHQKEVHKVFIWKDGKHVLAHWPPPFFVRSPRCRIEWPRTRPEPAGPDRRTSGRRRRRPRR